MKQLNQSFLLLIFIFCISLPLNAQYLGAKNGFSYRSVFINHDYPQSNDNFFDNLGEGDHYTKGVELAYWRHLNNYLNLTVPIRYGRVHRFANISDNNSSDRFGSLDALLHLKFFKEPALLSPYVMGGLGFDVVNEVDDFTGFAPLGLGLNVRFSRHVYLNLQSEYRFAFAENRDNIVHSVGAMVLIGAGQKEERIMEVAPSDMDGDGIDDANDNCPEAAGLAIFGGCPDSDGDGIADPMDSCPNEAGIKELAGCPDRDIDGDGIMDSKDRCPTIAGSASFQGCPPSDSDGDGIADMEDKCPNEAGLAVNGGCPSQDSDKDGINDDVDSCPSVFGIAEFDGCPDTDADGVPDYKDRCPNEIGDKRNGGCPISTEVVEIAEADKATLALAVQAVQFQSSRATLKPVSFDILDKIVDIMRRYPNYHLTISGHTDSIGDAESNQMLSEKRAKSCYGYIVDKGIKANRVKFIGYGEKQPIADNMYEPGRKQNRRVEFDLHPH